MSWACHCINYYRKRIQVASHINLIFHAGYSDGSLYSVLVDSAGGQCEDGLKMILRIGGSKMDGQSDKKEDVSRVDNLNTGSLDGAVKSIQFIAIIAMYLNGVKRTLMLMVMILHVAIYKPIR